MRFFALRVSGGLHREAGALVLTGIEKHSAKN